MKCTKCNSDNVRVIDSREFGNITKRRRKCLKCGFRYNTLEIPEDEHKEQQRTENKVLDFLHLLGEAMDKAREVCE